MTRRRIALALSLFSVVTLAAVALTSPSATTTAAAAQKSPAVVIGKAHPAEDFPSTTGKRPIFVLALGSDARSKNMSVIEHGRSDSIHIIGINPKQKRATILGIPRDSWVPVPGHGMDKINDAMYFGGPQGAVAEIESLTGIHIDYYMVTSFYGVTSAIHDLGGVKVDVPYAMNDPYSKAHFKPGVHRMSGKQALAFARDRHDPPTGDFGRSFNQGTLMLSLLAKFQKDFHSNPSSMLDWMGAGLRNVKANIPFDDLVRLGFLASRIPPKNVTNLVVPGTTGMVGPESVVHISSSANAIYADLKADGIVKRGA